MKVKNLKSKRKALILKSFFSYLSYIHNDNHSPVLCNAASGLGKLPGGSGGPPNGSGGPPNGSGRPRGAGGGSNSWPVMVFLSQLMNTVVGLLHGANLEAVSNIRSHSRRLVATARNRQIQRNVTLGLSAYVGTTAAINLRDFQAIQSISTRAHFVISDIHNVSGLLSQLTPETATPPHLLTVIDRVSYALHQRNQIQWEINAFNNPTALDSFLHRLPFVQFQRGSENTLLPLIPSINSELLNHLQTFTPQSQAAQVAQFLPQSVLLQHPRNNARFGSFLLFCLIMVMLNGNVLGASGGSACAFPFIMQTGVNLEYVVQGALFAIQLFFYAISRYLVTCFIITRLAAVLPKPFVEQADQVSRECAKWLILLVGSALGVLIVCPIIYIYYLGIWIPVQLFRVVVLKRELLTDGEQPKTEGKAC